MTKKKVIDLRHVLDLKGGENSHLNASLLTSVTGGLVHTLAPFIYGPSYDLGAKSRLPGWTNIGDISACLKTSIGLGELYDDSPEPHIVVASKHTRPVVIAKAKTQLDALIKAMAGDLNSPFGGFFGFNTSLTYDTAEFLDRMFIEGVLAPSYEQGSVDKLKRVKRRFLIDSSDVKKEHLNVFGYSLQPVANGCFIEQDLEPPFNALEECVVVTGNDENSDITSLDPQLINDIDFAGNAAIYLGSNLVFYVHNGAIAGLGDACGARTVAARKARNMLEDSAYAAMSTDVKENWEKVLYDTPFTEQDFSTLKRPLRLVAFSDAFFPKLDGFVETSGIDRIHSSFGKREVQYQEGDEIKTFIPKKDNHDINYDEYLIPEVVVQPGGSNGDEVIIPMADQFDVKMVFTMTPEIYEKYQIGEKGATGRRFFGHTIM
ncbi:hypothetical protein GOV14_00525 [Candidatus Pacearchaeota archaeon]|nr:hypothetical protein [Candidatus Pacearchaeota archaeon]